MIHVVRISRRRARDLFATRARGPATRGSRRKSLEQGSRAVRPSRDKVRPASPCSQTAHSRAVSGVGAAGEQAAEDTRQRIARARDAEPGPAAFDISRPGRRARRMALRALGKNDRLVAPAPPRGRSRADRPPTSSSLHSSSDAISPLWGRRIGGISAARAAERRAPSHGAAPRRAQAADRSCTGWLQVGRHRCRAHAGAGDHGVVVAGQFRQLGDRRPGKAAIAGLGQAMTRASGTAIRSCGAMLATVAILSLPAPARNAALAQISAAPAIRGCPAMISSRPWHSCRRRRPAAAGAASARKRKRRAIAHREPVIASGSAVCGVAFGLHWRAEVPDGQPGNAQAMRVGLEIDTRRCRS